MFVTNVEGLRDPFILLDNGIYYLYGTRVISDWNNTVWDCYINDSGNLKGKWKKAENFIFQRPADAEKHLWAPEVHKHNGMYYMFCTYFSSKTKHRGSSVFRASSPTGPFFEISDGHITPHDRDCIDATLHIDKNGLPWLVFVHEWTSTDDGVGRMDAAKLSEDFTHLISEPVELFRADSPSWTDKNITDGCYLHTLSNGHLIMIWSNFEQDGYCIGVAHSKNDDVDGKWEQEEKPLYKRGMLDHHDGGHGMLFTDTDGTQYICCHSPNAPCEECNERTIFIPFKEQENTLCIK